MRRTGPLAEAAGIVEVTGRTLTFQAGWWYRGEWSVEPHADGARIVHRVFNVARATRWAVPLTR